MPDPVALDTAGSSDEGRRDTDRIAAGKSSLAEVLAVVDELATKHGSVLLVKRRLKMYRDDYGRMIDKAWQAEIEYFRQSIVKDELVRRCGDKKLTQAMYAACVEHPRGGRSVGQGVRSLGDAVRECGRIDFLATRICMYIDAVIQELDEKSPEGQSKANECSPAAYEHLCADALRTLGWTVRVCGGSGDQGVDLVAEHSDVRAVIQCKRYSSAVGNGAVQEVYSGKTFYSAHIAAVMTSAGFTPAARALAEQTGVLLLHHSMLEPLATALQSVIATKSTGA